MSAQDGEYLRNAIIGVKPQILNIHTAIRKYDAKGRESNCALRSLREYEQKKKWELVSTSKVKNLDRWATDYTSTKRR